MGRIALIAEEMGRHEDAKMVAGRLAEASQVEPKGSKGGSGQRSPSCVTTVTESSFLQLHKTSKISCLFA